jgi:hypothetical protein
MEFVHTTIDEHLLKAIEYQLERKLCIDRKSPISQIDQHKFSHHAERKKERLFPVSFLLLFSLSLSLLIVLTSISAQILPPLANSCIINPRVERDTL